MVITGEIIARSVPTHGVSPTMSTMSLQSPVVIID